MRDLEDRLLTFTINTIALLKEIPFSCENKTIKTQLARSSSSIGANYQESQCGSSKEFAHRIQICLRESRETLYWFNVLEGLSLGDKIKVRELRLESEEITKIFGSISSKLAKKEVSQGKRNKTKD